MFFTKKIFQLLIAPPQVGQGCAFKGGRRVQASVADLRHVLCCEDSNDVLCKEHCVNTQNGSYVRKPGDVFCSDYIFMIDSHIDVHNCLYIYIYMHIRILGQSFPHFSLLCTYLHNFTVFIYLLIYVIPRILAAGRGMNMWYWQIANWYQDPQVHQDSAHGAPNYIGKAQSLNNNLKGSATPADWSQMGAKGLPEGNEREPKGSQREPNVS